VNTNIRARPGTSSPICHSSALKYVFIHIPKCAGSSIHIALRKLHEQTDRPIEGRKYHKHSKALDVRRILGPTWNERFTFSFVRNPWDLMVSCYHWWVEYAPRFPRLADQAAEVRALGDFATFLASPYGSSMVNEQSGRDLLEWISEENKIMVDFVGRYESLDDDWLRVCQRLKVEPVPLTHENRVARAHYRSFYDEKSRGRIAERFARTIEHFGYEF
jgi:hypothetical protein